MNFRLCANTGTRRDASAVEKNSQPSKIGRWFLTQAKEVVDIEKRLAETRT